MSLYALVRADEATRNVLMQTSKRFFELSTEEYTQVSSLMYYALEHVRPTSHASSSCYNMGSSS